MLQIFNNYFEVGLRFLLKTFSPISFSKCLFFRTESALETLKGKLQSRKFEKKSHTNKL